MDGICKLYFLTDYEDNIVSDAATQRTAKTQGALGRVE